MELVNKIAFILVIIGGLNWGLVIFDQNLVEMLLGEGVLASIVYALVALSALVLIFAKTKGGDKAVEPEVQEEPMVEEPMGGSM